MAFRSALYFVLVFFAVFQQNPSLAQGVTPSVREVQQALSESGFSAGAVDGVWGKRSVNSLKAYQRAKGLPITGAVDDRTINTLFPPAPSSKEMDEPSVAVQPVPGVEPKPDAIPGPPQPPSRTEAPTAVSERPAPNLTLPAAEQSDRAINPPETATSTPSEGGSAVWWTLLVLGIVVFFVRRKIKRRKADRKEMEYTVKVVPTPAMPSMSDHNSRVSEYISAKSVKTQSSQPMSKAFGDVLGADIALELAGPVDARSVAEQGRPLFGGPRRKEPPASKPANSNWLSASFTVTVGDVTIPGGMIYVGSKLPKKGSSQENENCLINPNLTVAKTGDPAGITMGYWPSYTQITPSARRSYLDWLAGGRSDPAAYVGYVFLYLYGLERRLILEEDAPDAVDVAREVERLLQIYGNHGSFGRYAGDLLSAYELKHSAQDADYLPVAEGNGYEVPASVKMALGLRVRDGKPIEPELLLRFARTHPETRVRTPARRAPELLEALFVERMTALHPNGFKVSGSRFKTLKSSYRACSGSFTVEVSALGGTVPDITERAEPISTARAVFEKCSDDLDDYSRALGRSPGLVPTLAAISKLPSSLRNKAIGSMPESPMERIAEITQAQRPVSTRQLGELLSIDLGASVGKAKLRELSQLLQAFGYGNTADPAYALRVAAADEQILLFDLQQSENLAAEPSGAYRSVQLSVMLGMVVAHADGDFDELEKRSLVERIEGFEGLTSDERVRLKAEISLAESDVGRLGEWTRRLKDVPMEAKIALAAELVSLAGADGAVHAAEVKTLEGLFKRMGLDQQSLYSLLHESGSSRKDDELTTVIEATDGPGGLPIPAEPKSSRTRIDFGRLNAIRSETRATASVLADIFVEEPDVPEPPPPIIEEPAEEDDAYDGLERRYGALISELRIQDTWSTDDFDNLVRTAGLMPGAARNAINDWAMDHFDELLVEGDGPYIVNSYLLPAIPSNPITGKPVESAYA